MLIKEALQAAGMTVKEFTEDGVLKYAVSLEGRETSKIYKASDFADAELFGDHGNSYENIVSMVKNELAKLETQTAQIEGGYEKMKERIVPRIISASPEHNADLKNNAYIDLVGGTGVIFVYVIDCGDYQMVSFPITEEMFKEFGVTERELLSNAVKAAERILPAEISFIGDALPPEDKLPDVPPFYVASNRYHVYGASVMLYTDLLKDYCRATGESSVYILPSSVHEVLLIPEKLGKGMGLEYMYQMVKEVNGTLKPEEYLDTGVYRYMADRGAIVDVTPGKAPEKESENSR